MKRKSNISLDYLKSKEVSKNCDTVNCGNDGRYLAPKSPGNKEMYIFCIDCVKIYNKRWNYFAGKTQSEIYDFQKNDQLESRPTRPFSKAKHSEIKFEFEHFFDTSRINFQKKNNKFNSIENKSLSSEIRTSLEILGISKKISKILVKKRYKELVKKYHPDLNKNFIDQEKKIREINKAYKILMKYIENNNASN